MENENIKNFLEDEISNMIERAEILFCKSFTENYSVRDRIVLFLNNLKLQFHFGHEGNLYITSFEPFIIIQLDSIRNILNRNF